MDYKDLYKLREKHAQEKFDLLNEAEKKSVKAIYDRTWRGQFYAVPFSEDDFRDNVMSYGGGFRPLMELFRDIDLVIKEDDGKYVLSTEFKKILDEKYGDI